MTTARRWLRVTSFAAPAALGVVALLLAACSSAGSPAAREPSAGSDATPGPTVAPTPTPQPPMIIIDWVDFIRFDGIQYLRAGPQSVIEEADLDQLFAAVQFNVSKSVDDPSYRAKDGDAAFLDAGTIVYAVRGYAPTFRLAARRDGRLFLYEVFANPAATRGSDLLDIDGKVAYIRINSEVSGRELTRIDDPDEVAALVGLVLEAPVVDAELDRTGPRYFIAFHLTDGTQTTHAFWLRTGELWRGIVLPSEFAEAVEQALGGGG